MELWWIYSEWKNNAWFYAPLCFRFLPRVSYATRGKLLTKVFCAWNKQRNTGYFSSFTTCGKHIVVTLKHSGKTERNFQLFLMNFTSPVRPTVERILYRASKHENSIIILLFQTPEREGYESKIGKLLRIDKIWTCFENKKKIKLKIRIFYACVEKYNT